MSAKKIVLSREALATMAAELKDLKTVKRVEVAERLKEAIAYGDLSENSEYQEARDYQAWVETRIAELEETVKNAEVLKGGGEGKKVNIGSTVKVVEVTEEGDSKPVEYHIVGAMEANVFDNKISNESPVGVALMGKSKGVVVEGKAPAGTFKYRIMDVK